MLEKQSKKIIIGMTVVVLVIAVIVFMSFFTSSGSHEYGNHLEMAKKYLDELDYEQAIVELRLAIEIEPADDKAYLSLAEVYLEIEDYESAIEVLKEGYTATGNTEFSVEQERIVREYAELQKQQTAQKEREQERRVEEFYEKYMELYTFAWNEVFAGNRGTYERYLTFAEREQVYGGLAEQLEQYLADLNETEELLEELYDTDLESYSIEGILYFTRRGAYERLAETYLRMGKLEECLQVRTEWASFCNRPNLVQDGNHGYDEYENLEYDRYGRITGDSDYFQYVYEEAHDGASHITTTRTTETVETDIIYDNEGRISHMQDIVTYVNGDRYIWDIDYSYTGNNSVVMSESSNGDASNPWRHEIFYNKYGIEIDF